MRTSFLLVVTGNNRATEGEARPCMADVDENSDRRQVESRVLESQPEAQAVRVAGAADVKAVQAHNQNAHTGSAGGDQLESVQIIAMDECGKQKVVAERQAQVNQRNSRREFYDRGGS